MSGFMVTPVATSISYAVGGAPTTTFVVPFPFDDIDDLVVTVGGIPTTAFTLGSTTEVDGFFTAGNVVLNTAVTSVTVTIARRTVLEQEVRFPAAGKFSVQALNSELSRLWMAAQDRKGDTDNAVRVVPGEAAMTELPDRATRALKYLAFDAAGDPVASPSSVGGAVVSPFMATVLDDLTAVAALTTLGGTAIGRAIFAAATAGDVRSQAGIATMNDLVRAISQPPQARSANYTLALADLGRTQVVTPGVSTITVTLPALAGVPEGASVQFRVPPTATQYVILDPNAAELIDNRTTAMLFPGESCEIVAGAAGWSVIGLQNGWRRIWRDASVNVAQIDFFMPTDFAQFRFEIDGWRPSVDAADNRLRLSTDGGVTFDQGATDYVQLAANIGGGAIGGGVSGNAAFLAVAGSTDNATANRASQIRGDISPGSTTEHPAVTSQVNFPQDTNGLQLNLYAGRRANNARYNAVRFFPSSGLHAAGVFNLFARY